ncbi:hypothetical protein [Cupriavidus metallidurans]|uniref:hypothetical protein n=1 Tax=Cupriavidus metallidurans TaxID=119219 RepID=UPI003CFFA3E8
MDDLAKPYSFITDAAFDMAAARALTPRHVLNMMKMLDTARDVAAGTSLILRMVINADIMDNSDGPKPQLSRTDLSRLQTLCQASQTMLEDHVTKLMDDINEAATLKVKQ